MALDTSNTVKVTFCSTGQHHKVARRPIEKGKNASVSKLVAPGSAPIIQDERDREASLEEMLGFAVKGL